MSNFEKLKAMDIGIRCNYCHKIIPYYNNILYKIARRHGAHNQLVTPDNKYRYCSTECAQKAVKKYSSLKYIITKVLNRRKDG